MSCFRKILVQSVWLIVLFISFSGCDVAKQAQKASNLAKCDFRISSVDNINLAGVELQHIKSVSDLTISDMGRIFGGFASPVFPLSLVIYLDVLNPNAREAGLNRLDWILYIDDIQMTSGILNKPIAIPGFGSVNIPVEVGLNLKNVLSGESSGAMLNFCMNLTGFGNKPSRFKIRLKPTVIVAGAELTYPGYITVKTTYTSK
ncbi:MAG: LEA type 2 family protein [Bacteroidales bacterium]|nr:LEA type 2 family protein [Bacteroidales bacterium]